MEPWLIAVVVRPLGTLIFLGLIVLPIRFLVMKLVPKEGKLRRILLTRIGK